MEFNEPKAKPSTDHMPTSHSEIANFIWSICNLLRGPYKRNEYRKVILPLTVLRRFDCLLADTKQAVLDQHAKLKGKPDTVIEHKLRAVTGRPFYNLSRLDMPKLLDDPNQIGPNLNSYINSFSPNVRDIMERFAIDAQIAKMAEKNLLYEVIKAFADPKLDLSADKVDNIQMGYVFEELIRIGAEQSNEEAGEHFTPREVIRLMVNLLLSPETDLRRSHVVKTIYDPACGTGGMLSEAEKHIRELNAEAAPMLYGQDWNDEAGAVCKSDMLIKGEDADNIVLGDTFTADGFDRDEQDNRYAFDYMLANPPFGVEWKQQQKDILQEAERGFDGRFGAGTPRINDGSFLFLQHMISKMRSPKDGGSRIAIVFNGSPLFTGDAGSGESNIRQWIIENDYLEAIVALPDQLFYNTGIFTYIWIVTNRKKRRRRDKVQLINAVHFYQKMRKSLGNKRHEITDDQIDEITRIYGDFEHDAMSESSDNDSDEPPAIVSKVFDNDDFGFRKITVERPLRLNFQASPERIERLQATKQFQNLATSKKKQGSKAATDEIEAGREIQRTILIALDELLSTKVWKNRDAFRKCLYDSLLGCGLKVPESFWKVMLSALSERDETTDVCTDKKGKPEPDTDLRDYENVPLKEDVAKYFQREVLPHVPDAWIDESKTKVGYEIPLNRHFYQYRPPRPLAEIESDIAELETEIVQMLREVVE